MPFHEKSGGKFGYISGQVDPRFVNDKARMLRQGEELAAIGRNVMVKIPGSQQGYEVIEELTARGIPTNNTTSFTVPQYVACMNAVSRGLERAKAANVDLSRWRSVITHMSARLGNVGDLKSQAEARGIALSPEDILHGELAVMKRAYRLGKEAGHPSKMLQCSMRVIDPGPESAGIELAHREACRRRLRLYVPAGLHCTVDAGRRSAPGVRSECDRRRCA